MQKQRQRQKIIIIFKIKSAISQRRIIFERFRILTLNDNEINSNVFDSNLISRKTRFINFLEKYSFVNASSRHRNFVTRDFFFVILVKMIVTRKFLDDLKINWLIKKQWKKIEKIEKTKQYEFFFKASTFDLCHDFNLDSKT